MVSTNAFQQPVGEPLPEWTARPLPQQVRLPGRYCRLEPLDAQRQAQDLFDAYSQAADGRDWTYMNAGPFRDVASYRQHAERAAASTDPLHYAVIDSATQRAIGTLALMRIDPANGVIEVGHVAFSPLLQRTRASTEAHFLLMRYVFEDLGYRRCEWKCDNLNGPSRQAAARLGYRFEGLFRQAIVYKGRSRDTAWFSVIDGEWQGLRSAFEQWLDHANFDAQGMQRASLTQIRDQQPEYA